MNLTSMAGLYQWLTLYPEQNLRMNRLIRGKKKIVKNSDLVFQLHGLGQAAEIQGDVSCLASALQSVCQSPAGTTAVWGQWGFSACRRSCRQDAPSPHHHFPGGPEETQSHPGQLSTPLVPQRFPGGLAERWKGRTALGHWDAVRGSSGLRRLVKSSSVMGKDSGLGGERRLGCMKWKKALPFTGPAWMVLVSTRITKSNRELGIASLANTVTPNSECLGGFFCATSFTL